MQDVQTVPDARREAGAGSKRILHTRESGTADATKQTVHCHIPQDVQTVPDARREDVPGSQRILHTQESGTAEATKQTVRFQHPASV
ncbi:hypothetical protein, partial [Pseudodesulfovibrio pelocollis]|uniref:hypothetical protein n=1 Tax=Pseudodesulfovibrio pelocollis TaxID=3051432 RepID=UPI00255A8F94